MRKCSVAASLAVKACMLMLLLLLLLLAACATPQEQMTTAALTGDTATLDSLLASDAQVVNTPAPVREAQASCPGQSLLTPLQAAACAGHENIVKKLLAGRADINLATGTGLSPLMLATMYGRDGVVRLLAQSGAKLDSTDAAGNTALMVCARKGNRALVELLLKSGASAKTANRAGETALLLAADVDTARLLADQGADPLARTANGESGLHLAARNSNVALAGFFIERGVDLGLRNRNDATSLMLARSGGGAAGGGAVGNQGRMARMARMAAAAPAAAAPESAANQSAVAALIEQRLQQLLEQELATGDSLAEAGQSAKALALYASALVKAQDLGGEAEQNIRTKIVNYAAGLPQAPAIPEKAREHLVRSSYLLKKGQDIGLVEREIVEALRLAPWWLEGYYNLGILQAGQNKFEQATQNLRLFMAAAPGDPRVQAAQDKIFEINIAKEEAERIRGMQGRWVDASGGSYAVAMNGDKMTIGSGNLTYTLTLNNGALQGSVQGGAYNGEHGCSIPGQVHPVTGRISPDARSISLEFLWSSYKANFHCENLMGVPSNCCMFCDVICDAATVTATNQVSRQLVPAE